MMTTAPDANVHALAIEGTFDDCQALVKAMFNHHAFRDRVRLSGVNSINWARIVAQAVYYFTAAVALGAPHRKVAFTVPTGNFGDVYAGYVASRMGLPVDRLVVATNVNDILVRAFATGDYEIRDVQHTTSPSMDIQVSSNFERLLFDAYGRDAKAMRALMGSLAQSRRFAISAPALKTMRALFTADRADEDESAATMRAWMREAALLRRSAYRRRARGRREGDARSGGADGRALDRASGQVSATRSRPPAASRPSCPTGSPIWRSGRNASACCRSIRRRSNAPWRPSRARRVQELRHDRRSDPSCLRPRRGDRPHAASGERFARGLDRRRQPRRSARRARHFASARTHGVQGHQTAQCAPDRRGDRGGRRRSQCRAPAWRARPITRACSRPTCRSRSMCCPTSSPSRPSTRRN